MAGMHDRGVVTVEVIANFMQRESADLADEVHRELPAECQMLAASPRQQLARPHAQPRADQVRDRVGRDEIRRADSSGHQIDHLGGALRHFRTVHALYQRRQCAQLQCDRVLL
jgi:hypothetical protein